MPYSTIIVIVPNSLAFSSPSAGTRRSMQSNVRRDTKPELAIRKRLYARGARYRVDYPLWFDRRRRADIVFTRHKVAVFVDGCFWHGCASHYTSPKANAAFWRAKIVANRLRDHDTNERLTEAGWIVLRFWEHTAPDAVVEEVLAAIAGRVADLSEFVAASQGLSAARPGSPGGLRV